MNTLTRKEIEDRISRLSTIARFSIPARKELITLNELLSGKLTTNEII